MREILILMICTVSFSIQAQSVSKTMKRLPDTGQKTSYTNTFGEDNDYSFNTPFYVLNGDGTVTDTVTGLMWQKTDGGEMTVENAAVYCDSLTLGGYTDWRLPNCHELFSILNHDKTNPAIDTAYFTLTAAEYWWSSQKQMNDASKIWCTNAGGGVGNHPKAETISAGGTKKFHVRAVRDVAAPPLLPNHFVDNSDGTVTDMLTDLMWQKIPYSDSLTWEQALSFSDSLTYAGYSDWRMPNIKELQSINDENFMNPSVNPNFFSSLGINKYWASTTLPNQTAKAWYLDTHFGITTYSNKTNKLMLLCVRNASTATGLNEYSKPENDISVFPNPGNSEVAIQSANKIDEITITDLSGKQIIKENPGTFCFKYSASCKGVYFANVRSGNREFKKRFEILGN